MDSNSYLELSLKLQMVPLSLYPVKSLILLMVQGCLRAKLWTPLTVPDFCPQVSCDLFSGRKHTALPVSSLHAPRTHATVLSAHMICPVFCTHTCDRTSHVRTRTIATHSLLDMNYWPSVGFAHTPSCPSLVILKTDPRGQPYSLAVPVMQTKSVTNSSHVFLNSKSTKPDFFPVVSFDLF